jgi:hypothetical protein
MHTASLAMSNSDASPKNITHCIIPSEDPQRAVEMDDDEDEGAGDGIGEEDGGQDDEEEDGDERDPADDDLPTPDKPTGTRRPIAPWLLRAYKAHVAECERRDMHGRPPLYATRKTFWFEQQSSIFILEDGPLSPTLLYNPRFFLWDPKALYKDLPCPICRQVLNRHAVISRPRRCMDVTSEFYIIGYRYRCPNCLHPTTKKKTVTFQSWDSRILAVLPPALAAEFPAYLSHRSGMSKALFSWMRMCFSNGMGARRFSDALLAEYLLHYDELQLQYLDYIASNTIMNIWMQKHFPAFLPFHDVSPDGRHGFVPSAQWFRDMYDRFLEDHLHEINQHTAMLSGDICAIDHSHKVCPYTFKKKSITET